MLRFLPVGRYGTLNDNVNYFSDSIFYFSKLSIAV